MRSAYSGSIPIPLSETRKRQQSSSRSAASSTRGAASPRNLIALRDQVLEDEPQQPRVAADGRQRADLDDSAPLSSIARARSVRTRAHQRVAVDVGVRLLHPPDARERQQVVDQVLHAPRAVDREADVLVRARVELPAVALLQQLAEATRPCAAAPGGRARRRRRTARARRWSAAGRTRRRAARRARRRSARASSRRPRRGRPPRARPSRPPRARSPRARPSRTPAASRWSGWTIVPPQHERHRGDAEQDHDPGAEHPEEHDVGVAVEPVAGVLAGRDQLRLQPVDRARNASKRSLPARTDASLRAVRGSRRTSSRRRLAVLLLPAPGSARSRRRSAAAAR